MEDNYYDIGKPGSFGGVNSLIRNTSSNVKDAKHWLSKQDAYTLHKPTRVHFRRRRVFTKGIDDLWQADLVDLSSLSRYNDGYRYVLTCIDAFSKRAHAIPLKSKTGIVVRDALEKIISEHGSRPTFLQTDKGTEFINVTVQNFLSQNDIKFYTSENENIKASICERLNRTIKEKMFRYFTYKSTLRYIDVLNDLMHGYNNSYHRSIKMRPIDVTVDNESYVRTTLYKPKRPPVFKFEVDDKVRISETRQVFQKGYLPHWTQEIFTVVKRHPTDPATYEIKDYDGEVVKGKFYAEELQKVIKEDDVYKIEKILKTRKRFGKTEHLVKWLGYPDKFNSWTTI
jgi:hypothetical protein